MSQAPSCSSNQRKMNFKAFERIRRENEAEKFDRYRQDQELQLTKKGKNKFRTRSLWFLLSLVVVLVSYSLVSNDCFDLEDVTGEIDRDYGNRFKIFTFSPEWFQNFEGQRLEEIKRLLFIETHVKSVDWVGDRLAVCVFQTSSLTRVANADEGKVSGINENRKKMQPPSRTPTSSPHIYKNSLPLRYLK